MDMASKNLAAQYMPDDVNFPGISAARTAYAVAQAPGFDQLAIYGPTAGAQTSMLIAGSTDYGPIVTCYGASDTQLLQQTGGVPAVPTLCCVGSGFWFFDPLILEFLADLLTDAAQQPPPQWNAAIDLALGTFYGVGYSAANPGARRIYDIYIARIYQFWPQAIQARVMASVTNYAKTSLTGGNLGNLMDPNGLFQYHLLLTANRIQALNTESVRYKLLATYLKSVQPNLVMLTKVNLFGGAEYHRYPAMAQDPTTTRFGMPIRTPLDGTSKMSVSIAPMIRCEFDDTLIPPAPRPFTNGDQSFLAGFSCLEQMLSMLVCFLQILRRRLFAPSRTSRICRI